MLVTDRVMEPLARSVTYPGVSHATFGLMAEAAVEAAVRLGSHDPWPVVRELERLCSPFEAPLPVRGEFRRTASDPRVRWALDGDAIDETGIELGARAQRDATAMAGALWAAVRTGGGPRAGGSECSVFPDVLEPRPLGRLGTATGEPLVDVQARHGWALLLCRWLGALSDAPLSVLCVQETQDVELGGWGQTCRDAWYGVVVQLSGATVWRFGDDETGEATPVMTRPGDVVLVPDGAPYRPAVPADTGRSRRMTLTLRRRELAGHRCASAAQAL
jgi:hypothetical protein